MMGRSVQENDESREAGVAQDLQRLIQARQLCFLIALTPPLARRRRWWLVATAWQRRSGPTSIFEKARGIPAAARTLSCSATAHGNRGVGPRAASNRARPRSSSLTTEIYNEFPVQPGRKFARARPLVPTTLHKRYRRRIAHSDLKQPFRQCGDAFVAVARNTRGTSRVARGKIYRSVRTLLLALHFSYFFSRRCSIRRKKIGKKNAFLIH